MFTCNTLLHHFSAARNLHLMFFINFLHGTFMLQQFYVCISQSHTGIVSK